MYNHLKPQIIIFSFVTLFLLVIFLFFTNQTVYATHASWHCFSQCTGACGGCAPNAGEYVIREWDWGNDYCADLGSDCRTQCVGPCRTCTPYTECDTRQGPNYCCAPNEKKANNVCNDIRHYQYNTNCDCVYSYSDTSRATHDCSWNNYQCCPAPPPPTTNCTFNGVTYTPGQKRYECGHGADSCNSDACVGIPYVCNNDGSWSNANPSGECTTSCLDCRGIQKYSCSGTSCVPDASGQYTTSSCDNACTAPPSTRYRCSGSSCIVDANGPYITSNCNNQCSNPPGSSCTIQWDTLPNNLQPNTDYIVRFRGINTNSGWGWVGLEREDGPSFDLRLNQDCSGSPCWSSTINSDSSGNHSLNFFVRTSQNGAKIYCDPRGNFTTQSPPPVCTNITPGVNQLTGCLWDGVNFNVSDGNAPDGIAGSLANFLIPPVADTGYTATAIDQNWGNGGPNAFVGSDTFSGRWRGIFNFKKGTYTFKIGSDDGVRLFVDGNPLTLRDSSGNTNSWIPQSWGYLDKWTSNVIFAAPKSNVPVILEYYEQGGDARITLSWTYIPPPPPISAWIQTIGGDVHSNGRIDLGGGP